jgi:hypothetical protein
LKHILYKVKSKTRVSTLFTPTKYSI